MRSNVLAKWACTELLKCVEACNELPAAWVPLVVDNEAVGAVLESDVASLTQSVFRVAKDGKELALSAELEAASVERRTEAVAALTRALREQEVVTGWRDELVPVATAFHAEPKFLVERAAYPLFGAKGYGVHVNGYTRTENDDLELWVGKRSATKQTWPGLLDHVVAGHQPFGISPTENVVKEAAEEAGLPRDLALTARAAGAVSYRGLDEQSRFKHDVLFCYDLELPGAFEPVPVDGEVETFFKWPLPTVLDAMVTGVRDPRRESSDDGELLVFKPNVVLVIADFLMRRGFLRPEMPDYLPLLRALRQGDCS